MANNTYEDRVKRLEKAIQEEAARKKSAPGETMETTWQQKLDSMYDDLRLIWSLIQKLKKAKLIKLIPDRFIADLFDGDTEKDDTPLKIPDMSYYRMNRITYNMRYNGTVYILKLHSGKKSGNRVEIYNISSPKTDDPKEKCLVYNKIYEETKRFIHDFYEWFDHRFPPEDNSDEE